MRPGEGAAGEVELAGSADRKNTATHDNADGLYLCSRKASDAAMVCNLQILPALPLLPRRHCPRANQLSAVSRSSSGATPRVAGRGSIG